MSNRTGYCSLTYLFSFEPSELNLDENCSNDEFMAAIEEYIWSIEDLSVADRVPNDVEISISKEWRND